MCVFFNCIFSLSDPANLEVDCCVKLDGIDCSSFERVACRELGIKNSKALLELFCVFPKRESLELDQYTSA